MNKTSTYTEKVEQVAQELGIENSVALDIIYLRECEHRIISAAKKHPHLRDFKVFNAELEEQLESLEK